MIEWTRAFNGEVGVPNLDVDSSIERPLREGRLFVWDDDGVVSMVGTGPPVAGVVRLAPVYTPPEAGVTAMPPPSSLRSAGAPSLPARRSACSTPIPRTRPPTASTKPSATSVPLTPRVPLQHRRTVRMSGPRPAVRGTSGDAADLTLASGSRRQGKRGGDCRWCTEAALLALTVAHAQKEHVGRLHPPQKEQHTACREAERRHGRAALLSINDVQLGVTASRRARQSCPPVWQAAPLEPGADRPSAA